MEVRPQESGIALYVMLIPGLLNLLLFKYLPMWGVVIGFQQFHPAATSA